jgi:phage gpG-like protein
MKLTVESDGGLSAFRQRVTRVAKGEHRLPVARGVAKAVQSLLEDEFQRGRDPDGRMWMRKADGNPSHLTDTRVMREDRTVEAEAGEVTITIQAPYAVHHQHGTSRMPQRQILPEGELPPPWRSPVEEGGAEALRRILTGET